MSEAVETVEQSVEAAVEETSEATSEVAETEVAAEGVAEPTTEGELQEAVEEAIEGGATKEEVAQLIEDFELKVNGKTIKKTVDWNDKEALKRELQLAAAGRQAMQESTELKKLYANEIDRLKANPWDVLKELGLDPDELAEGRIQNRIEEMKKSPEQIERETLQRELEEARNKLKAEQEARETAESQRLLEQAATKLDEDISNALETHPELPNSEYAVKKIADVMLWAMDQGWDDVTVDDVIPTVKEEIKTDINRFMDDLPEEFLEAYIGRNNTERLRNKRLKQMKQTENVSNIKKTATIEEPKEKPRKKIKIDDWMRG
jgi:hypothetical protein